MNPNEPRIGDLKISFKSVPAGMVSVVGQQANKHLVSYTTSNGRGISLLENGTVAAETMFAHAHAANRFMTWIFRLIGLVLMYVGFSMLFEFIVTITKVIPPLANLVGVGASIVALALILILGIGTIGVAWIAVRPLVGIPILILAL